MPMSGSQWLAKLAVPGCGLVLGFFLVQVWTRTVPLLEGTCLGVVHENRAVALCMCVRLSVSAYGQGAHADATWATCFRARRLNG